MEKELGYGMLAHYGVYSADGFRHQVRGLLLRYRRPRRCVGAENFLGFCVIDGKIHLAMLHRTPRLHSFVFYGPDQEDAMERIGNYSRVYFARSGVPLMLFRILRFAAPSMLPLKLFKLVERHSTRCRSFWRSGREEYLTLPAPPELRILV
jgi:hypothetical protein